MGGFQRTAILRLRRCRGLGPRRRQKIESADGEAGLRNAAPCATLGSVTTEPGNRKGHRQMNDSLPELGDLERDVMQLVWAGGPVTAEAVRERLSRPLKESTVRTVLRRLEEKGYTTHTVDGRTYVYQAAEPRGRVAAKAVQRVVDWFCNGSVEEVLVGMVDTAMLDQRQLRMLADKVAKAKANEKAKAKGGKK
jgi:BlaI family transcriptional regulator, penicillinase repressor